MGTESSNFKREKSFQLKEEEEKEVEKEKESGCFKWCPELGLAQEIITDLLNFILEDQKVAHLAATNR